jgi:hypothetical protein
MMTTYAAVQAAISQAQPVAFHGGTNLPHGSKSAFAITAQCDFSASGVPSQGYVIDTTQFANKLQMKTIQTVYIDNSQNNGYVDVVNPLFNQSFSLPAGYQGYFPILAPLISGAKFYVTSTGNQLANIIFLNSLMPLASWAATVTPPSTGLPLAVSDAILDATVSNNRVNSTSIQAQATAADASGTIATGGTAQLLMAANNARRGFFIQNIDPNDAEGLWFGFANTITPGSPGAYGLGAASGLTYPGGSFQGVASNAIYIVAATTGHKFSAFQW